MEIGIVDTGVPKLGAWCLVAVLCAVPTFGHAHHGEKNVGFFLFPLVHKLGNEVWTGLPEQGVCGLMSRLPKLPHALNVEIRTRDVAGVEHTGIPL
eukprot:5039445-Amphidinium_carterae.1